jgi:DNA (cytosine-5)-methyltransferase 1
MRTVDLFAGCGGLSLGLSQAGIDVIAAYENWKPAIEVYRANFDHPMHELDLSNVEEAIEHVTQYHPDMIVGGPPCQDFSSAGKRNESGTRADLTLSFAEIVSKSQPSWFVMENVERINKSKIYQIAKNTFSNVGYGLTEMVLDASLCGVPQKRKRMFLIGKLGEDNDFLKDILDSSLATKPMTLKEYFAGEFELEFYYRHPRSYTRRGIFSIDEPSPTIRGVNRPIPPKYQFHEGDAVKDLTKVRPFTTAERARIQTFPKDFIWRATTKSTAEQLIGNAVPVKLGEFVGRAIQSYIQKHTTDIIQPKSCLAE